MSGHLILDNMSKSDRDAALGVGAGVSWSKLSRHKTGSGTYVDWDTASRAELAKLLKGQQLGSAGRESLPPHRYLSFAKGSGIPTGPIEDFFLKPKKIPAWMDKQKLVIPRKGAGTEMCRDAKDAWNKGNLQQALFLQFAKGESLILEIYHFEGREMTEANGK
ncbi:hypothetical protein ACIRQY_24575 [Streptomyces sp. NPDC101490]|uniref:hypothetical protein n=1 Tax=Streptomyces sp. NPDC101490 TaxID=3366143 RepID=UPI0038182F09